MNNSYEDYLTVTNDGLDIDANNIEANCITSHNNTFAMDSSGNLTCNSITTSTPISTLTFNDVYPVGSIYLSVNDVNPGTLFTGTWEKITDRFLVGAGSSYPLGQAQGAASHSHTTPNHSHGAGNLYAAINFDASYMINHYETNLGSWAPNARKSVGGSSLNFYNTQSEGTNVYGSTATDGGGNTSSESNIPPYIAVNIWKRIS